MRVLTASAVPAQAGHAGVLRTLRETPRAVRFVLLGVFINQFGAFLQFFAVLYLTHRGFPAHQAGLALGAYSAGAIAGVLLGGTFADRLGARATIVLSLSSAALCTLSVTMLDALPAIVVAVALSGAMTRAATPAVSTLLFGMVPAARQVMVFAMYRTALNTGAVGGPLVAVWLSGISWNLVFYVDAATALGYAAIAAFVLPGRRPPATGRPAEEPETEPEPEPLTEKATGPAQPGRAQRPAGYLAVLRHRRYLAYLALMLANGLVHVQFFAVLPLMLREAGYPTWAYGSLGAASAFVVISSELLVTRSTQRWPARVAVMSGWLLLVVGYGAFGLPGGLPVLFAGTLLAAVGQVIGGPAAFAWPAKVAPPGATGRFVGSMHAVFGLGYALGPILGIALWTAIGNAFWALCLGLGLLMVAPGVWSLRPAPEPGAAPQPGAAPPPGGAKPVAEQATEPAAEPADLATERA